MTARLFLLALLLLPGCTPAARNVAGSMTKQVEEPPMDYIYALQVARNWGRIVTYGRNGHSPNLAMPNPSPAGDESGVTLTSGWGTFRCLYKDTPRPVVRNNLLHNPPTRVVLNCRDQSRSRPDTLTVWDTAEESKSLARAWKTMAAGIPKESPESVAAFEALAASYRADPAAHVMTEAVRELKIQAETAVREKKTFFAVQRFREALELSPWWPQGRFNLALIYGELKLYRLAVPEMEKYLKLAPGAPNARAAQDKIYAWRGETR